MFVRDLISSNSPTPEMPTSAQILHWLQADLSVGPGNGLFEHTLINSSQPIAPFAQPMPPAGSAPHRYIQLLWRQPSNFSVPESFSGYGSENRTKFDVAAFAEAAGLQGPIAANYFLTERSNSSAVGPTPSSTGAPTPSASNLIPFDPNGAARPKLASFVMTICGGVAALVAVLV